MPRIPIRKYACLSALALGAVGSLGIGIALTSTPVAAQLSVFDPSNYSQNLLTAARTLAQINNQIQSLQNEAQMLINQGKNLSRIDFPQLQELRQRLQQIDQLMGQAQGVDFRIDQLDERFRQLYPQEFDQVFRRDQRVARRHRRAQPGRGRLASGAAGHEPASRAHRQAAAPASANDGGAVPGGIGRAGAAGPDRARGTRVDAPLPRRRQGLHATPMS